MLPRLVSDPTISTNDLPVLTIEELSQICKGLACQRLQNMQTLLHALGLITPLLNAIPDIVFFIKDRQARYLLANLTLAKRCGLKSITPLLGKTSADVFPPTLGRGYTEQDQRVLREGITLHDKLEMHFYTGRQRGWCLTQKLPLQDIHGHIIGMAGISHDLQETHVRDPSWQRIAIIDEYIRDHFHCTISMRQLTTLSGLSVAQIERYCKRIFHLTPRQMIHKIRLEKATELLAGDTPITDIALQCGYSDHSAFSRQFKAMTGSTPRAFRTSLLCNTQLLC